MASFLKVGAYADLVSKCQIECNGYFCQVTLLIFKYVIHNTFYPKTDISHLNYYKKKSGGIVQLFVNLNVFCYIFTLLWSLLLYMNYMKF